MPTVVITVTPNGEINYSHAQLRAKTIESVSWQFNGGSFTISFVPPGPFPQQAFKKNGPGTIGPQPLAGVVPGAYRYSVACKTASGVFLDACCPEIIVET